MLGGAAASTTGPGRLSVSAPHQCRRNIGICLYEPADPMCIMNSNKAPELLLAYHLKTLRLPTFLCEHDKQAQFSAAGKTHIALGLGRRRAERDCRWPL